MPNAAVDWTVDTLLSEFSAINDAAAREKSRLQQNRANYMATLRGLAGYPDSPAKAAVKAQLSSWIANQLTAENRFNDYAGKWAYVKAQIKSFLQSVDITPPDYLGQIALVPAALIALVVAAGVIITWLVTANNQQESKLSAINGIVQTALRSGWSADQTVAAINAANKATGAPDPFGLANTLQAAMPVLLVIAALMIVPKILPRRATA